MENWAFHCSIVSIPRQSRGLYDCWPLKGALPQSVKLKTVHYSVSLLLLSFLRKQESSASSGFRVAFHLPGMTILLPELSNSGSPPAALGVYLSSNYKISVFSLIFPLFQYSKINDYGIVSLI
jgi:hypothetical protein